MRVLVGSKDERYLEQIGLDMTDIGLVPLFCDDPHVVMSAIRDQHIGVQIVLLGIRYWMKLSMLSIYEIWTLTNIPILLYPECLMMRWI